jgi:universal stress protein A
MEVRKTLKEAGMIAIERVMVPVDFSRESMLAAKFAASIAKQYHSRLYMFHVLEPLHASVQAEIPDLKAFEQRRNDSALEDLRRMIPQAVRESLQVEEILEVGRPTYHFIVERAKALEIDVIVIATHGRSGLAHMLLGSVAEKVIRYAPCPVFVIRNPADKYVYGWE